MTSYLLPNDADTQPMSVAQRGYLTALVLVRDPAKMAAELERARFGLKFGMSLKTASEVIDSLMHVDKALKTGYVKKTGTDPLTYQAYGWDKLPIGGSGGWSVDTFTAGESGLAAWQSLGKPLEIPEQVGSWHGKLAEQLAEAFDSKAEPMAPAFGYYEIGDQLFHWDVTAKDIVPRLRRLATNYYATGNQKKASWKKVVWTTMGGAQQMLATFTPFAGSKHHYEEKTAKVSVPNILGAPNPGTNIMGPLSKAQAAAKGKELCFCIRCGAELSDPISVANGIGPICASYWS